MGSFDSQHTFSLAENMTSTNIFFKFVIFCAFGMDATGMLM